MKTVAEAIEILATLVWWTLRSGGKVLLPMLRGHWNLAAVIGEG